MAIKLNKVLDMFKDADTVEFTTYSHGFNISEDEIKEKFNLKSRFSEEEDYLTSVLETIDKNGISVFDSINDDIKFSFIKYEISHENNVTKTYGIMINVFFKLDDNMRKYLSKFDTYLDFTGMYDDFALLKGDECLYYSCRHEHFDSMELDYKDMSKDDIESFMEEEMEYAEIKHKDAFMRELFKIIDMDVNSTFTFKDIKGLTRYEACSLFDICYEIKLELTTKSNELYGAVINGGIETNIDTIPASLAGTDDIITKVS